MAPYRRLRDEEALGDEPGGEPFAQAVEHVPFAPREIVFGSADGACVPEPRTCALVIALAAATGAFLGGVAGQLAGAAAGAIADWVTDFDEAGDSVSVGCLIRETGTWVTDRSHQHNEIHDISSIQIIECGTAAAASPLETAGAVGISRHPTGPDP